MYSSMVSLGIVLVPTQNYGGHFSRSVLYRISRPQLSDSMALLFRLLQPEIYISLRVLVPPRYSCTVPYDRATLGAK